MDLEQGEEACPLSSMWWTTDHDSLECQSLLWNHTNDGRTSGNGPRHGGALSHYLLFPQELRGSLSSVSYLQLNAGNADQSPALVQHLNGPLVKAPLLHTLEARPPHGTKRATVRCVLQVQKTHNMHFIKLPCIHKHPAEGGELVQCSKPTLLIEAKGQQSARLLSVATKFFFFKHLE